ncbi:MAG: ABC transporter ATP-binding protein [Chloroflexi bacterium]|nr:ABC transporter ATP-binding protein [Chloroflexota bacterium]
MDQVECIESLVIDRSRSPLGFGFDTPNREKDLRGGIEVKASPVLEISNLEKAFGGVTAVKSASFNVYPGEICSIVGPNGAGKTTLINLITGVYPPNAGRVFFKGHDLVGLPPHRIVSHRIARTFQNVRMFGNMSVIENVMTGSHRLVTHGLLDVVLSLPKARKEEQTIREKSMRALELVGLADRAKQRADLLPLGLQKLLELARSLVSEPELLLLDEPAAGLNDAETEALGQLLKGFCSQGITILLIEHNMPLVMTISDRVVVLNYGEVIAEGTPLEIRANPAVVAAYLGGGVRASD